MADPRLQRMLDDPEGYFAECSKRAAEMVERDMRREMELARERRRARLPRWLRWVA